MGISPGIPKLQTEAVSEKGAAVSWVVGPHGPGETGTLYSLCPVVLSCPGVLGSDFI